MVLNFFNDTTTKYIEMYYGLSKALTIALHEMKQATASMQQ